MKSSAIQIRVRLLLTAALLLAGSTARADITRFDLSGTVTDTSGGVLPGVSVTIKNNDTGQTRTAPTDERGRYTFTALDSNGSWTLTAELQGFQKQVHDSLRFQANSTPEVNFQLSVASLEESLTVKAEAPLVETRASELGRTLDDKQVSDLPTNGRNFLSLVQLSGSVVPTGSDSGSLSINGQGNRMADFLADGVSMTGREIRTLNGEFGGGNGLSLDVIQELEVITNGFKAEIGHTGAGAISIVTKSGTNQLHGSAYTFQRPSGLVANDLLTGDPITQKRGQYGATIGGPIARDRTFFFANYEAARIHDVSVVTSPLGLGQFAAPQRQDQLFSKINHRFNDRHGLDARFNFNVNNQQGQNVGGLSTFDQRFNTEASTYNGVASLVTTLNNRTTNEARFRLTRDVVDFFSPASPRRTSTRGWGSRAPPTSCRRIWSRSAPNGSMP
jgi:carboxypeptidase family protein